MIDPSPGIPTHVAMLLNERFDLNHPTQVRKRLKGMASDLRKQAEISEPTYAINLDKAPTSFRVALSGGLDLFAGHGACQEFSCRLEYADQVARSIILMADQVTMHDFFEEAFLGLRNRPTNDDIEALVPDVYVLMQLKPLIKAGILRFIPPYLPTCSGCIAEFDKEVIETTEKVLLEVEPKFSVERKQQYTAVHTGDLFDPEIVFRAPPDLAKTSSDEEFALAVAAQAIRSVLWDARDATHSDGVLFSNSPIGLWGLLHQDGYRLTQSDFRAFAGQRAAELPWVQGLTVAQTLQLRDEASKALPVLREFLAANLVGSNCERTSPPEYVAELREQAAAVRAELETVTSKSSSIGRNATGILGLGLSALSLTTEGPMAAISTLLATLGLVHSPSAEDTHAEILKTKPGYVLVAAQNILQHAR